MKKIEAVIRLSRFDKVRDALAKIGVRFFTMKEVNGFGLQGGEKISYRGNIYDSDYIARLQLDIYVDTDKVDEVTKTIMEAARTGEVGDGKIAVLSIDHIVRIRTGETNTDAI